MPLSITQHFYQKKKNPIVNIQLFPMVIKKQSTTHSKSGFNSNTNSIPSFGVTT